MTKNISLEKDDYTVEPLTGYDVFVKDYLLDIRVNVTGLLDSEKLLEGLNTLISEKWQVVGSRVTSLPNGKFELRIPQTFSEKQPPVLFEAYEAPEDVSLADCFNRLPDLDNIKDESDLLAFQHLMFFKSDIKKKMNKVQLKSKLAQQCQASKFGPIRTFTKDHFDSGLPLLTVLIYQFPHSGESVIRVLFPHCIFDASNIASFFRAWSDTVNGKLDNVPNILPISHFPDSIQTSATIKSKPLQPLTHFDLFYAKGFAILILLSSLLFRWIILPLLRLRKPSKQEVITIFIPNKVIESWRIEAREYAEANGCSKDISLSTNDLYTSWAMQKLAKNTNLLDGYFSLCISVNLRTQSPEFVRKLGIDLGTSQKSLSLALQNAKSFFPHNGIVGMSLGTHLWSDINRWPKWSLAYKIRQEVINSRKPENINKLTQKWTAINSNHLIPGAPKVLPFDPKSQYALSTSWAQSDIISAINFSSAVIKSKNKPKNKWAASFEPGKASNYIPFDAKQALGIPPIASTVGILSVRPGKGILVGVSCDPHIINSGIFGHIVDLATIRPD